MIGFIIAAIVTLLAFFTTTLFNCSPVENVSQEKFAGDIAQEQALIKYKKYKKPKRKIPFEEYCFPKSYSVQRQQLLAADFMRPGEKHRSLLVFHRMGAGKTCLAIRIARNWRHKGRPMILMPASLIPSFRNELRSKCAEDEYISDVDRKKLLTATPEEYANIIKVSDAKIDKDFQIYSYNSFATMIDRNDRKKIDAPILIIDEVQNVTGGGTFNAAIMKFVNSSTCPVVTMSGTPIFNDPSELTAIAKMMRLIDDGEVTLENIPHIFANSVSFFAGAPDYTYPEKRLKIKKCQMSSHQLRWYKSQVEIELTAHGTYKSNKISNDFYIKSRQRSNIVYPNGLTGDAALKALTKSHILNSLNVYSTKYAVMIKRLLKNKLSFIYSCFTNEFGIAGIKKILLAYGYSDFSESGPGKRRFAVFSGEQTMKEKDIIRETFNSKDNNNAEKIQIIIGSPAAKEGLSLLRLYDIHVLEWYWNWARLAQIFARGDRYCSHKSLPKKERFVNIYIYAAIAQKIRDKSNPSPAESIDLYMKKMADDKKQLTDPYVEALIDVAFDKLL